MTTNFFENIASLGIPGNWKITIQTEDNQSFTVSALFTALNCGDKAAKSIPPMLLSGTTAELTAGFFGAIAEPAKKTAGLFNNMEAYMKQLEEARLASKQEQDKKEKEKKQATANSGSPAKSETPAPAKPSREELNKAYDGEMEKVTELLKKFKFTDALQILPSAETYPHKEKEIGKKRDYLQQQAKLYEKALISFNEEK